MKCDELTPIELECNMGKDINGVVHREPWKAYDIDEVDAAIAELKAKLSDKDVEIEKLKAIRKVHVEAIASMGAGLLQDGEEIRRIRRALWLARAERAKEHIWHEVNSDGSPNDDYTGHDWVLVQLQEFGGFELIPRVAEYRRNLKRWAFIDEDYDTENTRTFRYSREQCKVIGWRVIDFAYYGKKFFVQQEINKNVERKCLKKAEEYR